MPLHGTLATGIRGAMKIRGIAMGIGLTLMLPACRKAEETVDQTRTVTMRDENLQLDATSNQRFQKKGAPETVPGQIVPGVVPEGWVEQPASQFRVLSYRFASGGDVAVGIAAGGMADNVNRWLGQFGQAPLGEAAIAKLPQGSVVGIPGLWVEAEGDFISGRGQEPKAGQGLYGIIAESNGKIYTVKMTGPAAEVAGEKAKLQAFVAALRERGE